MPVAAIAGVVVLVFLIRWWIGGATQTDEITRAVVRADLPVTVNERGELQSAKTIDVRCEVEGRQNKLISILPEGTRVTKGQLVATFDADELNRNVLEQEVKYKTAVGKAEAAAGELEVQKQKAASDIAKAELDKITAQLDREQYIPRDKNMQGDFQVDVDEKRGDIELAKKEREDAKEKLEKYRTFVKKGFGTPEQLRVKELELEHRTYEVKSKEAKLLVLMTVQRQRKQAELDFKSEDADRALLRAKKSGEAAVKKAKSDFEAADAAARSEKQSLDRLRGQLSHCKVVAPADGIIVYSKEYAWDMNARVQPGALMHFLQPIFSLPDLAHMQVKAKIHEAMVKKVKVGQSVDIQADAYPNIPLHGKVLSVATLADSRGYWDERGVKEYVTIIDIDNLPLEGGLKPGMTAQATIHTNEVHDVLLVPVQAVTEQDGKHCAYVCRKGKVERREVVVGENNDKFVEIKDGIVEGEQVALDARARSAAEAKAREQKENPRGKPAAAATTRTDPAGEVAKPK